MLNRIIAVVGVAFLIAGCVGAGKLEELKTMESTVNGSYVINENYQTVYQRIIESGELPTVEGKFALYTKEKKGSVWMRSTLGYYVALLEISSFNGSETATIVQYYCVVALTSWCENFKEIASK